MKPRFFKSQPDLHEWLEKNQSSAAELWVGFYKKGSGKRGITYREALDEALCFGWIDGIRKSVDEASYTIRFTPRKPKSVWSAVNVKRAEELAALGIMQPSGTATFEARDHEKGWAYSYENRAQGLDRELEKRFKQNRAAWSFFQAQPDGYRKTASWWVMSAKKDETRLKRLGQLINDSENNRRLGMLTRTSKSK